MVTDDGDKGDDPNHDNSSNILLISPHLYLDGYVVSCGQHGHHDRPETEPENDRRSGAEITLIGVIWLIGVFRVKSN